MKPVPPLACLFLLLALTGLPTTQAQERTLAPVPAAPLPASPGIALPWHGTLYTADGKPHKGTVEKITPEHIRFIAAGTAYYFTRAQLHPVTRGELRIGSPADTQAYLADLPKRQQHAALLAARQRAGDLAAQQAAEDFRARQEAQRQAQQQAEDRLAQQRQLDALENLAREAELRRLTGR